MLVEAFIRAIDAFGNVAAKTCDDHGTPGSLYFEPTMLADFRLPGKLRKAASVG